MQFSYLTYGLRITSDKPLPGLAEVSFLGADLRLTLSRDAEWLFHSSRLPSKRQLVRRGEKELLHPAFVFTSLGEDEFFRLEYSDGTRFLVNHSGTRLWGNCPAPLTTEDLAAYLVGPILGFVLRLRGILALHACCVAAGDHAVVLAGPSEAGKSTTAAALTMRGQSILCEDIAPVAEEGAQYFVEPGYPRVCLWPDSVEKLFGAADALPLLTPNWEKRFLSLENGRGRFTPGRMPLGAIYVFGTRTSNNHAPSIESLSKREAMLELVQNTYMNFLLDRRQRAAEFKALSRLVERVPVQRIVPHADAARLPALCDLLLENAHHVLGTTQPVAETLRA